MTTSSSVPNNKAVSTPTRPRRPRAVQACNFCRSKKYKCNGNLPCSHCSKHKLDCIYRRPDGVDPEAATYSMSYVRHLERRLELAEARVRQEVPGFETAPSSAVAVPEGYSSIQHDASFSAPSSEPQQHPPQSRELDVDDDGETEVVDVNLATNAIEFHGNTSSLAFFGHGLRGVRDNSRKRVDCPGEPRLDRSVAVTCHHSAQ